MSENAVVVFHQDSVLVARPDLKGRHSAGNGYFRAHLTALAGDTIHASGHPTQKGPFETFARALDPKAKPHWIAPENLRGLGEVGTIMLPAPGLVEPAHLRGRLGDASYSLVGVTHTTASHRVMDALADVPAAPVMPWDAIICTSRAVRATVETVFAGACEELSQRLGTNVAPPLPQLPVIPLGIHTADFAADGDERASARAALGLAPEDVLLMFVGRLAFHAKAHPHAMYLAAERVARKTDRKIVLLQCGWFANDHIRDAFVEGAATWCPSVRALFSDGRQPDERRRAFAAADIFVSLSDNIQETYGLTPVEAMAAGLPCLVTDWDGYRDTVRDGIDGFAIPTMMPAAPFTEGLALLHEAEATSYDIYCGQSSLTVALDLARLETALATLVSDASLRRLMGEAGRARARALFDWQPVFARYQALWAELRSTRRELGPKLARAPGATIRRADPARLFATYPTCSLDGSTRVVIVPDAPDVGALARDRMFAPALTPVPMAHAAKLAEASVAMGPASLAELASRALMPLPAVVLCAALLLKAGVWRREG